MKKRNQIEDKYKWDLTQIYSSDDLLLSDIEKLKRYPEKLSSYKGKLGKPDKCLEFLKMGSELGKLSEKISVYIFLRLSENLENAKYIELNSVVSTIGKHISVASSFEESELIGYGEEYIKKLMADKRFAEYKMGLNNFLRNKDHILDEREEIIVSKAMKALSGYSDVFDNIDNLDLKFADALDSKGKKHEVNQHNMTELLESKDRVLRCNAQKSITNGYHSMGNTISANYISSVEGDWFVSDIYKYDSVLGNELFGENIPKIVYEKLLDNVNSNIKSMHRFYALKKKGLGYKDFYYYDRMVSICNHKSSMKYSQMCEIVLKALQVLGSDYVDGLKTAMDNRWIDVYPCEKKESGGFCCNMYEPHPYVLLNTVEDSLSVYTLAHELGHAMHGVLSRKNQPYELYDHTIFLAEIASTVNEVLLFKYLYQNATTKKEKLSHLEKYIGNIIATIFRQTLYSEFEYFAHTLVEKGEPISKDILNAKYKSLTQKYYGKGVKLIKEDLGEDWMRIPHFYRAFYVYKYATGMTCAINFARSIYLGQDGAVERYKKFLSSGTSDYSINILKSAGIDLTTDEPYTIMNQELTWALDEFAKLV